MSCYLVSLRDHGQSLGARATLGKIRSGSVTVYRGWPITIDRNTYRDVRGVETGSKPGLILQTI